MTQSYKYYYSGQLKKYIGQFLRIFSGIQTQDGVSRSGTGINDFRSVAVVYGASDRIINALTQNQGTFTAQKIPIISAYMTGLARADDYRMPKHHLESVTYQSSADNLYHTVSKLPPVPYLMNMDLHLYASSTDQMFQMLEQILLWFNTSIDFQRSSSVLDSSYITKCTLTGIADNSTFPVGQNRRLILQTLTFEVIAYLNYPYTDNAGVIQDIILNIHDSSSVVEELDLVTPPPAGPTIENITVNSTTVTPPENP